jgi:hypothetical protein
VKRLAWPRGGEAKARLEALGRAVTEELEANVAPDGARYPVIAIAQSFHYARSMGIVVTTRDDDNGGPVSFEGSAWWLVLATDPLACANALSGKTRLERWGEARAWCDGPLPVWIAPPVALRLRRPVARAADGTVRCDLELSGALVPCEARGLVAIDTGTQQRARRCRLPMLSVDRAICSAARETRSVTGVCAGIPPYGWPEGSVLELVGGAALRSGERVVGSCEVE